MATLQPTVLRRDRIAVGKWFLGALLGAALHRAGHAAEFRPSNPIEFVCGDRRLEPFALANKLVADKTFAADWPQFCEHHGIGDLVVGGPELPRA